MPVDPIATKTVDLVQRAVEAGIVKKEWLDELRSGTVSLQDVKTAKKLEKQYAPGLLKDLFLSFFMMTDYATLTRHQKLVTDIAESVREQAGKQGFWKTLKESVHDLGRESMILPRDR